ncbi:hypothetical protein PCE1_003521 [Barthelona sp. PCE]
MSSAIEEVVKAPPFPQRRAKRRGHKSLSFALIFLAILVVSAVFSGPRFPDYRPHEAPSNGPLDVVDPQDVAMSKCIDPIRVAADLGLTPCEYVQQSKGCNDFQAMVPWLEIYYCDMKSSHYLWLIGAVFFILLGFNLLGTTADDFLCPPLLHISKFLKLSDALAGVTIISFANGAPDVFSILAGNDGEDATVALGAGLGSAAFIISLVLGAVVAVNPVTVRKFAFVRDIVALFIATIAWFAIVADGEIHIWECIAFLAFYVIYVLVVVVTSGKEAPIDIKIEDEEDGETLIDHSDDEDEESGIFGKIMGFCELPFTFLRYVTVPVIENESRFFPFAQILVPLLGSVFFAWGFEIPEMLPIDPMVTYFIIFIIGAIASLYVAQKIGQDKELNPNWVATFGVFVCIVWMFKLADETVALLRSVGVVLDIPDAILSLLILSAGNSIGDLATNVNISKKGRGNMAVAATYAGPLFNVVVGLGVSFLFATMAQDDKVYNLGVTEFLNPFTVSFIFIAIVLILALLVVPLRKYVIAKGFGIVNVFLYIGYIVAVCLVAMINGT